MRSTIRIPFIASLLLALACASNRGEDGPECDPVVCTAGHCEVGPDRAPQCVCGAYELAAGLDCKIAFIDTLEPNDTADAATVLTAGGPPLTGYFLASPGRFDRDWFAIPSGAGETLRVQVRFDGGAVGNALLRTTVQRSQEFASGGWVNAASWDYWIERGDAGVVLLELVATSDEQPAQYELRVENYGVDAPVRQAPLVPGDHFSGEYFPPATGTAPDSDTYSVSADAGARLKVACDGGAHITAYPDSIYAHAGANALEFPVNESSLPYPLSLRIHSAEEWRAEPHYGRYACILEQVAP